MRSTNGAWRAYVSPPATPPPSPASTGSPFNASRSHSPRLATTPNSPLSTGIHSISDSLNCADKDNAESDIFSLLDDDPDAGVRIDMVRRLPPEVSWELFLELNPVDVSKCGLVSRSWRAFARNETLWREICKKAWLGKQFHPLELHPLVNWGIYNNISVAESMQILKRRGVVIRGPTTTQPPCANWPSSTYPVNLSSWSWTHWQPSDHSPTLAIGWEHTAVPDLDDDASDEERYSKEIIQKVQQPEQENAFPSERDLPWLERLLSVTLPAHAPPAIPTSCGKWMASYVAAERDRTRTLITRSELTRIKWKLQHGRDIGNAVFQEDGLWFSDVWPHHEWWRIRRDGRPQVNFYAPLTVQRRDGSNSSPNDWGFVMTNEFSVFVSTDRNPPPISITMTGRTTYQ